MYTPPARLDDTQRRRKSRLGGCLLWSMGAFAVLFTAGMVALASAYAGWSSGVDIAQATAAIATENAIQQQCQLLPEDLATGKLDLARARLDSLRGQIPPPDCLLRWSPMATQAYLDSLPSPTPSPTQTPPATQAAPPAPTLAPIRSANYDLDALLAEAQAQLTARDFYAAIDTLDAIISLDPDFQRDLTRERMLDALTTQAELLFESGKLSEAIVLSERAEQYGDIGDLSFLREVALMLQRAQLLVGSNPAEAVRLLRRIVYDFGSPRLMAYDMEGELQAALAAWGDRLLADNACNALAQYDAALELQPSRWKISEDSLLRKREVASRDCGSAG